MKKIITVISALCILLIFTAGSCEAQREVATVDTNIVSFDLKSGDKVSFDHEVEGIKIQTLYDTNGYELSSWMITQPKQISYSLILSSSSPATVLVEHVHVDLALRSQSPQLDGQTTDSMDDSYHGAGQDGFLVTSNYSYSEIFAIEGYSKELFEIWGYVHSSFGYLSGSTNKLTEMSIRNQRTYAQQLTVVYNLLIKHPGEEFFHTVPIADTILIPLDPNWKPTTETYDLLSGNVVSKEEEDKE